MVPHLRALKGMEVGSKTHVSKGEKYQGFTGLQEQQKVGVRSPPEARL